MYRSANHKRFMFCITLNLIKKWMLLFKCCRSGRLRELKNKGKDQLVIHKSGRGRLRERSLSGFSVKEFN